MGGGAARAARLYAARPSFVFDHGGDDAELDQAVPEAEHVGARRLVARGPTDPPPVGGGERGEIALSAGQAGFRRRAPARACRGIPTAIGREGRRVIRRRTSRSSPPRPRLGPGPASGAPGLLARGQGFPAQRPL